MVGKKLLKHSFGSSLSSSAPPSSIPTPSSSSFAPSSSTTNALNSTATRASSSSEAPPPGPAVSKLARPAISLPPALAALVPPPLLASPEPLPRLVVFDLDYTLWPFWVDTHPVPPIKPQSAAAAAAGGVVPMASPSPAGGTDGDAVDGGGEPAPSETLTTANAPPATSISVIDRHGEAYAFYPDVASMLWIVPRMGCRMAVASRTHAPDLGKEMLKLMVITPPPPLSDESSSAASMTSSASGAQSKKDLKPRRAHELFDGGLEIYPGSKMQHMQALARRNGVAFDDMLFFDDEPRNKEVEALGVTFHLVPDGMSWRELERGIEEWRRRRREG